MAATTFDAGAIAAPPKLVEAPPETAGMDADRLSEIDAAVREALDRKRMPGCVVLVGRRGTIVYRKAFGDRRLLPEKDAMTTDTLFDLASLTKPIATATSVMKLVEQGKVALDDPVAKHLPEFGANGKEKITVLHLLTHQGGLIADNSLRDYRDGRDEAMEKVLALKPVAAPGERFIYSDMGFVVLAELVQRVSGKSVHEFSQENVFQPLGMSETGFLPAADLRKRAAVTQKREGRWMQGEVHDPRAYALDGVAGHAGLFSTADDLAVYAQMMLGEGSYGGVRVLKPETVKLTTRPVKTPRGLRGLGWDSRSPYSSNRGKTFSDRAFGHGGFTGTALWIDPELDLFVIFLSNRVHPDGKGSVNALAGNIGTIAADGVEKWTPLFNGKNLDGWSPKITGYKFGENFGDTFYVEDGVMKVGYSKYDRFNERFGHLFYKEKFSHYRLRVEYRFVGEQCPKGPGWAFRNSGLMLHCQSPESMTRDQKFPVSIEVQLLGGRGTGERPTANLCTPGTNVVMDGKLFTPHCINSKSKTYHEDRWVTMEVEVRGGGTIKHIIDGKTVIEYSKPQLDKRDADAKKLIGEDGGLLLKEGYISLQSESHPVEFRKVEIMKLKPPEDSDSK